MRQALGIRLSLGRYVINVKELGSRYARTGLVVGPTVSIGRKMPAPIDEFYIVIAKRREAIVDGYEVAREGGG